MLTSALQVHAFVKAKRKSVVHSVAAMNCLSQRVFSSRSSAFVATPAAPCRHIVAAPARTTSVVVEAKLKTRKAAAKRFKVTGSGKLVARHGGKQHMNEKQTTQKKRDLSQSFVLEKADVPNAIKSLPYAGL